MLFQILSLVLSFTIFSHHVAPCVTPPNQVSTLNDLYSSTNGNHWKHNSNWGVGDPCNNNWYKVTCDSNCNVTELLLETNNLSGTIPSTIGNLINLQQLGLYGNNLSGTIPSTIGNLIHLYQLWLDSNNLSGIIPSTIGNLIYLNYLYLNTNNLSGTIPSTIGNLIHLYQLYLNTNNLSGTIPSTIGNLINLEVLDLSSNELNGTVPWQQNPDMQIYFDISNNQFSCPLPSWCSPYPTGDGLCAPCVNVTTNQFLCCYYSNNGCQDITFFSCAKASNCPSLSGLENCAQIITSNCDKWYPNDRKTRTIIN